MGSSWSIVYIVVMFALLYFVLIRPQNKQRKEQAQLLTSLKKGDKVVTIGGLHGSIVELNESRVTLKVSDTTRVVFERGAIKSKISDKAEAVESPAADVPKDKEKRYLEGTEEDKEIQKEKEESK
nr:preprotein translocase subunit YajC [Shimazuella kribbensis]